MCYEPNELEARRQQLLNGFVNGALVGLALAMIAVMIALFFGAAQVRGQTLPPNQAYRTLPNGTLQNSAGQNVGRWERDASGNLRFRNAQNGQLSNWKVAPNADGGSTYVPSPLDMPPLHPGLPNPR